MSVYTDAAHAAKELGALPKPTERGKFIGAVWNEKRYFVLWDYRYNGKMRYPVGFEVRVFWMWINNEWTLTSRCKPCAAPNKEHIVKDYTGKYDSPKHTSVELGPGKRYTDGLNELTNPRWKTIEETIQAMSHEKIMSLDDYEKRDYLNEFIPHYRWHYKKHGNPEFARNFARNMLQGWFFKYPINVKSGVQKPIGRVPESHQSGGCSFCHGSGMVRGKPCSHCEGST